MSLGACTCTYLEMLLVHNYQIFSEDELRALSNKALVISLNFLSNWGNFHNVHGMRLGPPWIDHFSNKVLRKAENIYKLELQRYEDFFLRYEVGGKADVHLDTHATDGGISTVTLLQKSDDLEGGNVIVEGVEYPQEVGDTIFYGANTLHGVTEVTKGKRVVLIGWYDTK